MMDFSQKYNRENFVAFLQNEFLPEDDFLTETKEETIQQSANYIKKITQLGTCKSLNLAVYEARHTSTNDARVGLSKEIFRFMANKRERKALVLFVPQGNDANYRFSLISIDLEENAKGNIQRIYSNPRRYSYYLGEGIAYYTPNKYLNEAGRIRDSKDLTERFSVDVLTKAFYQELSDWYAWAVKEVRFPNKLDDPKDDDKFNAEATIRLVTRLIFVWFLKQKHLIPEEFFDEQYIADNLLKNFSPNLQTGLFKQKSLESKYYKAILQNLFFAMLNSPITPEGKSELSERHFRSGRGGYDNNKLMRYESMFKNPLLFIDLANKTVPFLNGGLFDCLDDKDNENYVDGFSDRKIVQDLLVVPDYLFFGEEVGKNIDLSEWYGDKKKKKVSARGIIDILKRYNFTVEENTPFDQDVSLDPELLGKVFENLLASYNPETKTTARKQTGSFYTPREIVQYMVDESLVAHLKRTVGDELEPAYRTLLRYTDEEVALTDAKKKQIMQSLYTCKILDPACGSGAFPVGMLQQMVHILSRIDPDNERWKEIILDEATKESRDAFQAESKEEREERLKDIERSFDEKLNNPDYARKLYLIENCIYGVDIQSIAIQISKLRFFISLVVDQRTTTDPVSNFGIRPLPNLEAKFVAANTLIPLAKAAANLGRTPAIMEIERRLKEANHKIFNAKTVKTKRKWKERLGELRSELIQQLSDNGFLTKDAVNQMASWDMFDQNATASFFDADWMFGIKEGFDIVIGNPPYIKEYTNKSAFDGFRECSPYYQGKMDLWYGFACHGIDLLRENGFLCFIAQNNWTTSSGAKLMRKKIISDSKIKQLLDFNTYMVFENADIQTMVMLFERNCTVDNYSFDYRVLLADAKKDDMLALLKKKDNAQTQYQSPEIVRKNYVDKLLTFNEDDNIFETIARGKEFLLKNEVAQGIVFPQDFLDKKGADKLGDAFSVGDCIFGLTQEKTQKLSLTKQEQSLIKPYYDSAQIHRYFVESRNLKWLIYTDSRFKKADSMNNYPNLKKHLDKFIQVITSDNKPYGLHRAREERFFKGEKIISLRKCVERPLFSWCDFDTYVTQTYFIIQSSRWNMKFLTGVLNSKLIAYWLKHKGKMQGANYQVDKEPLLNIPLPKKPTATQQKSVIVLVDKILAATKQGFKADTKDYESDIDKLVYRLYGLTYDEVKIIDPDTPITREKYEK